MSDSESSDACDFTTDVKTYLCKANTKFKENWINNKHSLTDTVDLSSSSSHLDEESSLPSKRSRRKLIIKEKHILVDSEDEEQVKEVPEDKLVSEGLVNECEELVTENVVIENLDSDEDIFTKLERLSNRAKSVIDDCQVELQRKKVKTRNQKKKIDLPIEESTVDIDNLEESGPIRRSKRLRDQPVAITNRFRIKYKQNPPKPPTPRKPRKCNQKTPEKNIVYMNLSSDDEPVTNSVDLDPIVQIKTIWRLTNEKVFSVRKYQLLKPVYDYFINEYNINPKLILFTINDLEVDLNDNCYVSLKLDDSITIEGGVLPVEYLEKERPRLSNKQAGIKLKIQCSSKNREFNVFLKRDDSFELLFWQIVKKLDLSINVIKLFFDGGLVSSNDTIEKLDIEEEDCLDLVIK